MEVVVAIFVYVAQYNFCDINQEMRREGFCRLSYLLHLAVVAYILT